MEIVIPILQMTKVSLGKAKECAQVTAKEKGMSQTAELFKTFLNGKLVLLSAKMF